MANGVLLQLAAHAGFEAFVTVDKNLEHEQNLKTLPLPVIVLDAPSNALPALAPFTPFLLELIKAPLDRALFVTEPRGTVHRCVA